MVTTSRSIGQNLNRGTAGMFSLIPPPFYSMTNRFMPQDIKTMYRVCQYLYSTNPLIAPILKKHAAYVITKNIYTSRVGDDSLCQKTKKLLEIDLEIEKICKQIFFNTWVYGVGYVSLVYPHQRSLECKICGKTSPISVLSWEFHNFEWTARCKECGRDTEHKSHWGFLKGSPEDLKIKVWNPHEIRPKIVDYTSSLKNSKKYLWDIPKYLREQFKHGKVDKDVLLRTSDTLLEAIQEDKSIELDQEDLFVFEADGPSFDSEPYIIPPLLNVLKSVMLQMYYYRANEMIAAGRSIPMSIIHPVGPSPTKTYPLFSLRAQYEAMIQEWHRDNLSIHFSPIPLQETSVAGQGNVLRVDSQLDYLMKNIAAGLGLPASLVTGDMTYTGSSINMRILENQYLSIIEGFTNFKQFILSRLHTVYQWGRVIITHQDFKMADDPSLKSITLQLLNSNIISEELAAKHLGFDFEEDQAIKERERLRQLKDIKENQVAQNAVQEAAQISMATAQGKAQVITAAYQAKAQLVSQKVLEKLGANSEEITRIMNDIFKEHGMAPISKDLSKKWSTISQDQKITHFLKSTPDHLKEEKLSLIADDDPGLAKAIRGRMGSNSKAAQNVSKQQEKAKFEKTREDIGRFVGMGARS